MLFLVYFGILTVDMPKLNREKSASGVFAITLDPQEREVAFSHSSALPETPDAWNDQMDEGRLAIDIGHTENEIVVVSTMAGAAPDKIEVYIHTDLLTIRGVRTSPFENTQDIEYYYHECFWGKFSRTVVLPTEVKGELARAEYKNGILTIVIPKRMTDTHVPVVVVDE